MKECISRADQANKFVVKIMRVPDQELHDLAIKEFRLLQDLKSHKNIIEVVDIFYNETTQFMYTVMECAGEGDDLH